MLTVIGPRYVRCADDHSTFAVGCGGIAASLFGMNLPSGLEHSPYAFYAMASTVFLMSSSVFFFFLRRMRSLVRNKRYTP